MASVITVTVLGGEELEAKLRLLGAKITATTREAVEAGGKIVLDAVIARTPVRTGRLKENIEMKVSASAGLGKADIGPTQDAFYGAFVEMGHATRRGGHVPARPFMRPGFDESQDAATEAVGGVWHAAVREVTG